MHDVAAETFKTASEGRSRFDAVVDGLLAAVVSTEGSFADRQESRDFPSSLQKNAVLWFKPGAQTTSAP